MDSEVVNSTQGFYSLTGLQPGSNYHLMIKHGNDTQWENMTWTIGPGEEPRAASQRVLSIIISLTLPCGSCQRAVKRRAARPEEPPPAGRFDYLLTHTSCLLDVFRSVLLGRLSMRTFVRDPGLLSL